LAKILKEHGVDLVVLIGYMRILTPEFVHQFPHRIINVHPALIPKFSGSGFYGANVHEEVLKSKEKETGCTIHFVEEEVDAGEIIVQKKVAVDPSDTPETLKDKVQALEKKWYPEVIRWFAEGKIK
jgi:phosphoribosylglycinamide formyltransferase 1